MDKPSKTGKEARPARPRHRAEGGYARGGETRARIVDAAIRVFGERGYEGASTRDIARLAEVNAPALQYYFDNKEGVYRACAEHIAESAWTHFRPWVEAAEAVLAADAGRADLYEAFHDIQDAVADYLLSSREAKDHRLFVAHEQADHGPRILFDIMNRDVRTRMKKVIARLIARLTGRAADDPVTILRMMVLHGQLHVFHSSSQSVLAAMGWKRIGDKELATIKQIVRETACTLIESWTSRDAQGKGR